jgi:hypothetical protein
MFYQRSNPMDAVTLALTTQQLMPYLQQYGPLFAAKAVEALGEKVPDAVGKLWQAVKSRFDAESAAKAALEKLIADPQNDKLKNVVEFHLEEYLKNDQTFAEKIQPLLKEAQAAASHVPGICHGRERGGARGRGEGRCQRRDDH